METWLEINAPHKKHPERTCKSYALQEAESMSRAAKVAWCDRNGHAAVNLQHDGVAVLLTQGTDVETARSLLQRASETAVGYHQPCTLKPPETPEHPQGHPSPPYATREQVDRLPNGSPLGLGRHAPPVAVNNPGATIWRDGHENGDEEGYGAVHLQAIREDPVTRLFTRVRELETGAGIKAGTDGPVIKIDEREMTIMSSRGAEGIPAAISASRDALAVALELHARWHFTHAAAVDGSLREQEAPNGRWQRRVAYGIWEGARMTDDHHTQAASEGLSGGRLPSDFEIADAEMIAIYAYLRRVVTQEDEPGKCRVLILSDCKGVLLAVEEAWRARDMRRLRGRDRGALLEAICTLRAQLGTCVTVWNPAHKGNVSNAYADACAKAYLDAPKIVDTYDSVGQYVTMRPHLWRVRSDFDGEGNLQRGALSEGGEWITWDRRLFRAARRRLARWLHVHLRSTTSDRPCIDDTYIGRRGHETETRSWAEVTRAGVRCKKLERGEPDPVERMERDREKVGIVAAARHGDDMGMRGTHDVHWRRRRAGEARAGEYGAAARHGAGGCPGCAPNPDPSDVCGTCGAWRKRGGRGALCEVCGQGAVTARTRRREMMEDGWTLVRTPRGLRESHDERFTQTSGSLSGGHGWIAGGRGKRRLGTMDVANTADGRGNPWQGGKGVWVGFAGLSQTCVERLLRDGRDEDARARRPESGQLADLRHVMGGCCPCTDQGDKSYHEARECITRARTAVEIAGGHGSALWTTLTDAGAYCEGDHDTRAAQPRETWEAMRATLSYDLPKPDWREGLEGAGTPLTQSVVDALAGVNAAVCELKTAWKNATARTVRRREGLEGARGTLRVILRAWREVADGVPAAAAKWEQEWEDARAGAGGCVLASRLAFKEGDGQKYYAEEAWLARLLITWMRLCRAGKVRAARRGSEKWRSAETERRRKVHALRAAGTRKMSDASRCQDTHHQAQQRIIEERGVTSGAAAVIEMRKRRMEEQGEQGAAPAAARRRTSMSAEGRRAKEDTTTRRRGARQEDGERRELAEASEASEERQQRQCDAEMEQAESVAVEGGAGPGSSSAHAAMGQATMEDDAGRGPRGEADVTRDRAKIGPAAAPSCDPPSAIWEGCEPELVVGAGGRGMGGAKVGARRDGTLLFSEQARAAFTTFAGPAKPKFGDG